jgi:MFS family permease
VGLATRLIILAGGPCISLATSLIQPILPKIEADLANGPDDAFLVKMLIGVMGVAMVIGAAVTGFLVDRFGLKRIMTANYAIYALAGTAGVYLNDLQLLLVSRFLLGMAASGAVTGSIIIINSLMAPNRRATWLGYYNGVAQLSAVLFNPLSGFLGEMNWHWSFAIYGIAAPFAAIALLALQGRAPIRTEKTAADSEPLVRWFPFRFAVIGILLGVIIYIPAVYLPFLLSSLGMTSPQLISLVLTGDILAGSIAALMFGRVRRSVSEAGAFKISVGMAGAGLLIAGLAPNYVVVIIGSIFFGIGVAWFLPTLMLGTAVRVASDRQGRAAGLVKGANYMGSPIAVFLAEPVARNYGPSGAILTAAALALVLLVAALSGKVFGKTTPIDA